MPHGTPMVDILENCATGAGCTFYKFSQVALIHDLDAGADDPGRDGICYGLAVTWLERHAKGKGDSFFNEVKAWQASSLLDRSRLIYANQKNHNIWQSMTGLQAATAKDGTTKKHEYVIGGGADESTALANWFAAAMGTRYFLLHVKKHSMAAMGSKTGKLHFFDPNSGVATSSNSSQMAAFLLAYFTDEKVNGAYKGMSNLRPNAMLIEAEKFKK